MMIVLEIHVNIKFHTKIHVNIKFHTNIHVNIKFHTDILVNIKFPLTFLLTLSFTHVSQFTCSFSSYWMRSSRNFFAMSKLSPRSFIVLLLLSCTWLEISLRVFSNLTDTFFRFSSSSRNFCRFSSWNYKNGYGSIEIKYLLEYVSFNTF